jgi:hypothetical protein
MIHDYTLRFATKRGCSVGVVAEMAKYDNATVVRTVNDLECAESCVRAATFKGNFRPTMGRWASFPVGATLVGDVKTSKGKV